jgi:hypothetical protein
MLYASDKVADVDQPQIEMKIVERSQRPTGHGDSVSVEKIRIFGRTYFRVANHGDITWEDESGGRLDNGNTELELALECGYREKYFATEKTINGTK